jgi:hypothetical protein
MFLDKITFRFEGGNRTYPLRGDSPNYLERERVERYYNAADAGRLGADFWTIEHHALATRSERYEVVDRVTDEEGCVTIVCRFVGVRAD